MSKEEVHDDVILRFATKRAGKVMQKIDKLGPDWVQILWRQDTETGYLRSRLLAKLEWSESWAVEEWHKLPKPLQTDLMRLQKHELIELHHLSSDDTINSEPQNAASYEAALKRAGGIRKIVKGI